jgi:hypothetical protein
MEELAHLTLTLQEVVKFKKRGAKRSDTTKQRAEIGIGFPVGVVLAVTRDFFRPQLRVGHSDRVICPDDAANFDPHAAMALFISAVGGEPHLDHPFRELVLFQWVDESA